MCAQYSDDVMSFHFKFTTKTNTEIYEINNYTLFVYKCVHVCVSLLNILIEICYLRVSTFVNNVVCVHWSAPTLITSLYPATLYIFKLNVFIFTLLRIEIFQVWIWTSHLIRSKKFSLWKRWGFQTKCAKSKSHSSMFLKKIVIISELQPHTQTDNQLHTIFLIDWLFSNIMCKNIHSFYRL